MNMIETISNKMHHDEFNANYLFTSVTHASSIDAENRCSNGVTASSNSSGPNIATLLTNHDIIPKKTINHNCSLNENNNVNDINKDSNYITKETMHEYISIMNANEITKHVHNYTTLSGEKEIGGHSDLCEMPYTGNSTSPKSVSSQCSNTTAISASNSLASNCNLNCENGNLILAYSPPTSNVSASSTKSFISGNDSFKLNALRFENLKHDTANLSPSESRSPSAERLKMDTYSSNTKRLEREAKNLIRKEVIPQRKRRDFIPEELKDEHYWERRRKNNLAAKRSREKRRLNDIVLETKVIKLTKDNNILKLKLELIAKAFKISEEEIERMLEENKDLVEACENVEISDLTNDSSPQDGTVITEIDSKESESLEGDVKRNSNKNYSSKSSCSSNSSINDNSSGEEIVKRTKLDIMKSKKNPLMDNSLILQDDECNKQVTENIEKYSQDSFKDYRLIKAKQKSYLKINAVNDSSNYKADINELNIVAENNAVKSQYPLLYGQLCRAICNSSNSTNNKNNNVELNRTHETDFFGSNGSNGTTNLHSNLWNNNKDQVKPMIKSPLESECFKSELATKKLISIYDHNKEGLNEASFIKSSSQVCLSLSELLQQRKNKDENTGSLEYMSMALNELHNDNLHSNSKDALSTIMSDYFKKKSNQSKSSPSIVQNNSTTHNSIFNDELANLNSQKCRISTEKEENLGLLYHSSLQSHVNKLSLEETISNKLICRKKKRNIQGDVKNEFEESLQQYCHSELVTSFSSSESSNDETENVVINNQNFGENGSEIQLSQKLSNNIRSKLLNLDNNLTGKSNAKVKIRKINSRSPPNLSSTISKNENKEIINRNSVNVPLNLDPNGPPISLHEILTLNNNCQTSQKVLVNGKCNGMQLNGNSYVAVDNMPLKLRFKMLQLKTGEVN